MPGFGFGNEIQNDGYDNQIDYDGIGLLDPILLRNFTCIKWKCHCLLVLLLVLHFAGFAQFALYKLVTFGFGFGFGFGFSGF
jgi:hypothetical protein